MQTVKVDQMMSPGYTATPAQPMAFAPGASMAGVAVDAQDGIWIALADGWSVVRFSSEGNVDRVLSLPVSSPTGLAIAAGDGATPCLFVTSDRHLLPLDVLTRAPWSGRLLRIGFAAAEH